MDKFINRCHCQKSQRKTRMKKKYNSLFTKKKTKNEETTMKYLQIKTMLVTRTNRTLLI